MQQENARALVSERTLEKRRRKAVKTGKPEPAHRTFWQGFWTWRDIVEAQQRVGWSPAAICKYLWDLRPEWYRPVDGKPGGLYRGTVGKWIDRDPDTNQFRWTPLTLQRVENGQRLGASGRSKILVCCLLIDLSRI